MPLKRILVPTASGCSRCNSCLRAIWPVVANGVLAASVLSRLMRTVCVDERGFAVEDDEARHAQADAIGDGEALIAIAIRVFGDGVGRIEPLESAEAIEAGRRA